MHVLLICPQYPNKITPGYGSYVQEQFLALKDNLKDCKFGLIGINIISVKMLKNISFNNLMPEKDDEKMEYVFKFIGLPFFKRLNYFIRLLIFKAAFKKYIALHGKPDLIHLHIFEVGELALWLKKTYNIPYVVTEHSSGFINNTFKAWQLDLAKRVFINSSKNIAVSNEFKVLLEKMFECDFTCIPNLIKTNYYKPSLNSNKITTFCNIAYLNSNKNHKNLILAFTEVFKGKNYLLKIGGNGHEYNTLKKLINSLGMSSQIHLLGMLNKEEVLSVLQSSDYFVLSSKVETFGIVLIEAMSCGIPVLSTKSGGPESIITDKKLGLLCENNYEGLVNGFKEIIKQEFDSYFIRDYVVNNYSEFEVVKRIDVIYREVLNM
jgi:glycosyltransferase involved in cell wall biosynthesis